MAGALRIVGLRLRHRHVCLQTALRRLALYFVCSPALTVPQTSVLKSIISLGCFTVVHKRSSRFLDDGPGVSVLANFWVRVANIHYLSFTLTKRQIFAIMLEHQVTHEL